MSITILDHPLAAHWLTQLRDKHTQPDMFRTATSRLTALLTAEATRGLAVAGLSIDTPLEPFAGSQIASHVVAVPILRAGLGMLDAFVAMLPRVSVGYIGLARDEETAIASSYYDKLPPNMAGVPTFVLDPMLATGGSASHAVDLIKSTGAEPITLICIVAAPEGVAALKAAHPDIHIVTAAVDRELNDRKYIMPGLGDFGDRLYGTLA